MSTLHYSEHDEECICQIVSLIRRYGFELVMCGIAEHAEWVTIRAKQKRHEGVLDFSEGFADEAWDLSNFANALDEEIWKAEGGYDEPTSD